MQELLKQIYLSHPDWEQDYLALLKSRKGAQRSLAVQTLAGIGVEQYRPILQEALTVEKNSKLIDQLTSILGTPAPGAGEGSSRPSPRPSWPFRSSRAGRNGRCSGCWINPCPQSAAPTRLTPQLLRIRLPPSL